MIQHQKIKPCLTLSVLLAALYALPLLSQPDYHIEYIDRAKGLPHTVVLTFHEDRRGFIWIGTADALARYDGYQFLVFRENRADSTSLAGSSIRQILEDSLGSLWIVTDKALNRLDGASGRFEHFFYDKNLPDSARITVRSIHQDPKGILWVVAFYSSSGESGLYRFDPEKKRFSKISFNVPVPKKFGSLVFGPNGVIWMNSQEGLLRYDGKTTFIFKHNPRDTNSLSANRTYRMYSDSQGLLWVQTAKGWDCFDSNTRQFKHYEIKASSMLEDRQGRLWLSSFTGGIVYFDRKKDRFSFFPTNTTEGIHPKQAVRFVDRDGILWINGEEGFSALDPETGLSRHFPEKTDRLWTGVFFQDREGNVWVAGPYSFRVFKKKIKPFRYYHQEDKQAPGLSSDYLGGIWEGRDSVLWVGGDYGLNRLDLKNKKAGFQHGFPASEESQLDWSKKVVTNIYEDHRNRIWVFGQGMAARYDLRENKTTNYESVDGSIAETTDGAIWVSGYGGISRYDPEEDRFFKYPFPESVKIGGSQVLCRDRSGYLWMGAGPGPGGVPGLLQFDPKTARYKVFRHDPNNPHSLSSDWVQAIFEDKAGNLWVGTKDAGLNRMDRKTGKFRHYQVEDGLPGNMIYDLLEDDHGKLWISTNDGLSKFDPLSGVFINFDETDGLRSREFNGPSAHKSQHSGILYFGTVDGLLFFHPDSIQRNSYKPPLVFTGFKRYNTRDTVGTAIEDAGIAYKNSIRLSHRDNILVFEFAALSFHNPAKNQYAYKLEGFSDQWIPLGNRRQVTLTNLDPDKYVLRVKGSNNDGIWNEEGISLEITITPPWYWAWYTKTLYLLLLTGGLYALYRWRTREQRLKIALQEKALAQEQLLNARLRQIDQLKDQFLANTSHELRTPLHGIIGIAESLFDSVKKRSAEEIQQNLGLIMTSGRRLASLVNDLLDFSRVKNRDLQLQPKSLNLRAATAVVLHACRPLLGNASVELINKVPEDLLPVQADENRLQQILFNLVGNAIKFTREGYIAVNARQTGAMTVICIEDTGIGIPKDKHEVIFQSFEQADGATAREFGGAGLGLSITRQLVELHGGQIWLESEPGKGSAFFFSLPVSDNPTQLISETSQVQVIPSVGLSDLKLSLPVPQTAGDRVRILVVDDEPINHQVLRNYLGEEQFLITSVMSGQEAIESIELGVKFDLVLLDVMMPQISGYQVCQKIREKHLPSELPIIMVTAKNQIQDLVEGLGVGANDYLAKPFSRDEFLARVKTQLDLHLINEVTGKFVPTAFLRALGRERITEVSLGDFTQKVTTILFADIRDYTSLSESMTPEENFRFVSAFNGRMGPIIQRHNGFINQYLGDAIMAIFQTPSDSLKSAVAMHRQLAEYNQTRRSKDRRVIHNGIGIHTGPLIMGITGDKERMDAATIADTVNTASRIENITKHYGANILLSEDSLNDITDRADFHFRYLGKVQVKGKSKAVGIYECFSGDAPQIIEKKLQTLSEFEKGVQDFFAKEFSRALDHFNHVLIANPEDQSAKHLLNRTAQCIQHGVPPDWTGVEIMEMK